MLAPRFGSRRRPSSPAPSPRGRCLVCSQTHASTRPHKHRQTNNTTTVSAALRGDGAYAGACCGVRAEVVKAAARWWSAAFTLHEVDAGICYATGCNARAINWALAAEELLHGMVISSGADGAGSNPATAPQGTRSPYNLYHATNLAAKCRPGANSPINRAATAAFVAASAAAEARNPMGVFEHYRRLEASFVARFLQYSLLAAKDASGRASARDLRAAGACRAPCLREAQAAAARVYFMAAEPIVAKRRRALAARARQLLAAPGARGAIKEIGEVFKQIVQAFGMVSWSSAVLQVCFGGTDERRVLCCRGLRRAAAPTPRSLTPSLPLALSLPTGPQDSHKLQRLKGH